MPTISFTKEELEALFQEWAMLVQSAEECRYEGIPHRYDKEIMTIAEKIKRAKVGAKSDRFMDTFRGRNRSKWDRFKDPEYHAND